MSSTIFIPALRIKQDILPDRYTYLWFTADKTGAFHMRGILRDQSFADGRTDVIIVSQQDYGRWTSAQPEGDDLAHQGEKLFRTVGCSGCHDSRDRRYTRPISTIFTDAGAAHRRPRGQGRRGLSARHDFAAEQGHPRRLCPRHAELPRRRRRPDRVVDRVPEIADHEQKARAGQGARP